MDVRSSRIRIRPTTHDDLPFLQQLWNDAEVMTHKGYPTGMHVTEESMERWWAMTPQAQWPEPAFSPLTPPHCTIELSDGAPIGELAYSVDMQQRATIDIKLARECWGQGYAVEALTLAARKLFTCAGVKSIVVEQPPANERAVKLLQRCGFRPSPTENHPDRWECTRVNFTCLDVTPNAEVA